MMSILLRSVADSVFIFGEGGQFIFGVVSWSRWSSYLKYLFLIRLLSASQLEGPRSRCLKILVPDSDLVPIKPEMNLKIAQAKTKFKRLK